MTEETEVKTMWSETLLESLYVAMEKQIENNTVIGIIKDLKAKNYEDEYLIDKIGKKVGPEAAARLKSLLSDVASIKAATPQKSEQVHSSAVKPEQKEGLVDKVLGIFK